MKRYGQVIRLKPEGIKKYVEYHAKPWAEVNQRIEACHIQNYSIFIKDDLLFAYFEYVGENFDKDMEFMAQDEHTQRWWDLVKPLMLPVENRKAGEFWANMEEIYHLH